MPKHTLWITLVSLAIIMALFGDFDSGHSYMAASFVVLAMTDK